MLIADLTSKPHIYLWPAPEEGSASQSLQAKSSLLPDFDFATFQAKNSFCHFLMVG